MKRVHVDALGYPRELYPGFREVFGYLLLSSGEGAVGQD